MSYQQTMTFVSYAQNFEDVLLWRALGDVGSGFYIDIGAAHPDTDSVTRAFYDRGWSGINVEPTSASFLRLVAARPRDVNLQLAIGKSPGKLPFFVMEGIDTGLSTLDDAAASTLASLQFKSAEVVVDVDTLPSICRQYAPRDIHFLKIDVEGAELAVLEGADFATYRPWVVLVEATAPMSTRETHAEWEHILIEAGYRFVWFDGLNRFYVALEHHDRLAPKFRTPPNVFDNFLRAADTEWVRRLTQAETRSEALLARAIVAEGQVASAIDGAEAAQLRSLQASIGAARAQAGRLALQNENDRVAAAWQQVADREQTLLARLDQAERWLDAMRRSTSWRLTGPLRRLLRIVRPEPPDLAIPSAAPAPAVLPPVVKPPRVTLPLRAVHQFHSGTAVGDAITNAMLLTRDLLRGLGYDSQIFAEHRSPAYDDEFFGIDALPAGDRYALIVRHSMGHDALSRILALPAPKILLYHNITPPELLGDTPHLQAYAVKGREQLTALAPAVVTALADSEYNALELRRAGFRSVAACALLFDVARLIARAPAARRGGPVFTLLFVGRLARSKGQLGLVAAYARFRTLYQGESRLILVGRNDNDGYAAELFALVRRLKLDTGAVEITGMVSDHALHDYYATADLYVSLSQHEGFGVPLVEAMAHGLPIAALASGAVPYTLGGASALLSDTLPAKIAAQLVELALDPARRGAISVRQFEALDRFRLERQIPVLINALQMTGVAAPASSSTTQALAGMMQFTVAGHVNGSYSLAEVNRALALALEAGRPGAVCLLPVEGDVTADLSGLPPAQSDAIRALIARPSPLTGPHMVVSQHYPVWVPPERADLTLAWFFWEESLVPDATVDVLNAAFDGVLVPSRAVAKALVDSGVQVPVRVLGHAPNLYRFSQLREDRHARPPGDRFTFLHVSSGFPRKGIDVLLAAYTAAFRSTDAVTLIVKTFPNIHNTVDAQIKRIRASDLEAPRIELIDADLPEDAMLDLYRRADTMVLPTRGEGYNLPAAEALAAGLSVVVTGFGGHMDFVGGAAAGSVRLVDYEMAASATHLSTPFSLWAEPDPADLAAALRESVQQGRYHPPEAAVGGPNVADQLSRIGADLLQHDRDPDPAIAFITTWDVPCGVAGYARHLVENMPRVSTIFADRRTAAREPPTDGVAIVPAWNLGGGQDLRDLAAAIVHHDPRIVVLQHQPGLLEWRNLALIVGMSAMHRRILCITLHNTQHLLDIPEAERASAVGALAARVARGRPYDRGRQSTVPAGLAG